MKSKRLRLFDKAWKVCSAYIRKRDNFTCFTCGKKLDKYTSQAGHFIHGKHTPIYFNEFNLSCQCIICNHFKSGNRDIYLRKIQKKYGIKKGDELLAQRDKVKYWKVKELEEIITHYTKELEKYV